jgi:archaemetzincin
MPELEIITIQFNHNNLLDNLISLLRDRSGLIAARYDTELTVQDCYDQNREQYDAIKIIKKIGRPSSPLNKVLVYTSLDLYIPVLTFVFGLAGLGGSAAIISSCRLINEFYGLPADEHKLIERLFKETIHEYGHLQNLRHCHNYQCIMASSNTVDDLDVKGDSFCTVCADQINLR